MDRFNFRTASFLALSLGVSCLAGCGGSFNIAPTEIATQGSSIQGQVMGGQQPIVGAKIFLMQANPTVWKGASTSLLTSSSGGSGGGQATLPDVTTVGTAAKPAYYVSTSAPGGTFNISGDYSCTAGTQVYLLGLGGNSLGTSTTVSNAAIVQMALLGNCPSSGSFAASVPFITLNELSTVAAAYSLAGFATDYLHIGGWATTAQTTGLANAFLSAGNLVSLGSGKAYASTPAGNGTVPQTKLNTLADIIATCVNTTSSTSSACGTLFTATPNAAGTKPTTTFDAVLNLAQNPTINTTNTALINQPTAVSPFLPYLSANPNDWTVSVKYTASGTSNPGVPDVDSLGNVWIPNFGGNSLTELSTTGAVLSGTAGFTGGGLSQPAVIAVDRTIDQVWVADFNTGNLSAFSGGTAVSGSPFNTGNTSANSVVVSAGTPYVAGDKGVYRLNALNNSRVVTTAVTGNTAVAVDPGASIWAAQNANTIAIATGGTLKGANTYSGGGLANPGDLVSDFNGNMWASNVSANVASEFSNAGTALGSYTGAGLVAPEGVVIDGYNKPWFSNTNGSISALTSAGTAISGTNGYTTDSTTAYNANPGGTTNSFPNHAMLGLVIDQSGNLWAPDFDNSIYEFVGITAPPVPIVQNLQVACGTKAGVTTATGKWLIDTNYVTGGTVNNQVTANAITAFNNVNPAPQAVYQAERYGKMTYTMSGLTAGTPYTVNLHFSEDYFGSAGQRVFNVTLNGTQVLTNFDVFAAAGGEYISIIRSFTATADTNGNITVGYIPVTENPKCSGIEVVSN